MSRDLFHSFEDKELSQACIGEVLRGLRGQSPEKKLEVYRALTAGQRALFMFHVWHDHACHSADELYAWSAQLISEQSTWAEIRQGLAYFGALELLQVMDELELMIGAADGEREKPSILDLDRHPQLREELNRVMAGFQQAAEEAKRRIGLHVRANPGQFVELVG
ncbi:hypothetical protein SAMN02799630_01117 [Paenibacillus sp. UNCCL117]|uniref:hypothetical protein n=1 Tax=unclassified Paenibacillus TaxID=185978 RepID=UPI000891D35F|nr:MULTISPECIES: hypothetical protein [unclassified Paenibacillus]SDC66489.1 hypothetical protein SAMN04488602_10395 [Paenibacillus sp. cl123]SFW23053.1 hypothetical protein SAMN02799630_01117 [Paenibacillus sp. UNCCL117]